MAAAEADIWTMLEVTAALVVVEVGGMPDQAAQPQKGLEGQHMEIMVGQARPVVLLVVVEEAELTVLEQRGIPLLMAVVGKRFQSQEHLCITLVGEEADVTLGYRREVVEQAVVEREEQEQD